MERIRRLSQLLKRSAFALACTAAIGYFSYHVVHGDYGLIAWFSLQSETELLRGQISEAEAKREILERNVSLLRPDSLDPDMLDERARQALNYAHPNDITIMRNMR